MVIAGLQKSSLIDYPGKVSCVVFVTGCNFTCPYCHNPELVRGQAPHTMEIDSVLDFIHGRRNFLDGVVITGGEPTLWPGLGDLCGAIQSMGLAVKLDTNGSQPNELTRLIETGRLNYLAMDLKTTPDLYAPPICRSRTWPKVKQSIALIMQAGIDYEFRTTCVKPFVDPEKIQQMAATIAGAHRYVLQTFRPHTLLDRDFFAQADPAFTQDQLKQLQAVAAPLVQTCCVR